MGVGNSWLIEATQLRSSALNRGAGQSVYLALRGQYGHRIQTQESCSTVTLGRYHHQRSMKYGGTEDSLMVVACVDISLEHLLTHRPVVYRVMSERVMYYSYLCT